MQKKLSTSLFPIILGIFVCGLGLLLFFIIPSIAYSWPGELAKVWELGGVSPTAAAWGDWDNDGDLDLAIGFDGAVDHPSYKLKVYENQDYVMTLVWTSPIAHDTTSLAWGDWDGDGYLDLAEGCSDASVQIYRSGGGTLTPDWTAPMGDKTESVDFGDWDNDGDLDLAVGNSEQANRIYQTDGVTDTISLTLAWSSPLTNTTHAVAWGNWDEDPELELAVGNKAQSNYVYDFQAGIWSVAWVSPETDYTEGLDWGDYDGDGDLDLAVSNTGSHVDFRGPDRVYVNGGGSLALAWTSAESRWSMSTAWGDYDGDGDLDLAMGNALYQNNGETLMMVWEEVVPGGAGRTPLTLDAADWDGDGDDDLANVLANRVAIFAGAGAAAELDWSSAEQNESTSVAWGDVDGDGNLDLAVGNTDAPLQIYTNDDGSLSLNWSAPDTTPIHSVAWGDIDGDGDLDLAVGNDGAANRLFTNEGGTLTLSWSAPVTVSTRSVAWGDWDRDGDLDLAAGNYGAPIQVYENGETGLSLAWTAPVTASTQSLAWGDWNNDGKLDLAVGNDGQANQVYENSTGAITLVWTASISDATRSVAWGDWDGDSFPDLAVGNYNEANLVYENDNGVLGQDPAWASPEDEFTESLVWGDWDGDGDLDLAAGNYGEPIRVYGNRDGDLVLAWSTASGYGIHSVAWGDYDGDGDLDLATGNDTNQPVRVFANPSRMPLTWSSPEADTTYAAAWGDWDGDGDLDLAVGNSKHWVNSIPIAEPLRVYANLDGELHMAWTSAETDTVRDVAWGDWDGDGDLDLAVINNEGKDRIYRNTGGALTLAWTSLESYPTTSAAWGDYDNDGDLDLAVGNAQYSYGFGNDLIYRNDGGTMTLAWTAPTEYTTHDIAWADWDGDQDLDLLVGTGGAYLYENQDGAIISPPDYLGDYGREISWGDWDSDGDPDLAVGGYGGISVLTNTGDSLSQVWMAAETNDEVQSLVWGDVDYDGDLDLAVGNALWSKNQPNRIYVGDGSSLDLWWSSTQIEDSESVAWGDYDRDGDLDLVVGNSSLVGSTDYSGAPNRIYESHAADVQSLPDTTPHIYLATPGGNFADFYSSVTVHNGPHITFTYTLFDPEGDPARFIRAYYSTDGGAHWQPAVGAAGTQTTTLAASPTGVEHTYTWDVFEQGISGDSNNTVFRIDVYQGFDRPGPYQYPFRSARTYPFRVRGSQVRVMYNAQPMEDALVFRLPAGQSGNLEPYRDPAGELMLTGPEGYLEGWGEIGVGDRLYALVPITRTDSYTLYYGSAPPTLIGVETYTVSELGVQTLVVSPTNPLILLSLDVSLEWDAREDEQFLAEMEYNFRRTSEVLFDWTNGQVALGPTTVYHDRQNWLESHVRIYATNRMRPNAAQGGIVSEVITDTVAATPVINYAPGQVHIGAVWNRYGDPSGALGEDWPRTLAHELGHYALFLDDNYLGFDESGLLIPVEGCTGSAMTDPYRDDYSEFRMDDGWLPDCEATLSNQTTGRADWETVKAFYPFLDSLTENSGPTGLPLAVTEIQLVEPVTPTTALEVPIFYISQDGHAVQPGKDARAFLFQGDRLADLGRPILDQVLARGASPGDRLCVYELAAERMGCEDVSAGDEQLVLVNQPGWLPDVTINPVTSRTIQISVTNVSTNLQLMAQLFPLNDPALDAIPLILGDAVFSGTFEVPEPALNGAIHLWVDEVGPRREIVTDFSLGGNPGYVRGRWGYVRGRWGYVRGRWAPGVSSDGQVLIFGNLDFGEGEFITLQAATLVPSPLPWATVVGHAYRLSASPNAPVLTDASISFMYAGSEVPPGEESFLKLYFWDGASWQQLPTGLDPYHNNASTRVVGPGVYALMSSIEIPLVGPGWNLIAYPVQATRPVTEALASIEGSYGIVYGYDVADPVDPWRVHGVGAPPYVNSLEVLEFGHGYWISMTESITLMLKGGSTPYMREVESMGSPPATFYGQIAGGPEWEAAAGMEVVARVNGVVCGRGETLSYDEGVVYLVHVLAEAPGGAGGCGTAGDSVSFEVDQQTMEPVAQWDNRRLWELPLVPASSVHRLLSVFLDGLGAGVVSSAPAGISCPGDCSESYRTGTIVTLTAAAGGNSSFAGWTGACSGNGVCAVSMSEPRAVTATFDIDQHWLSVTISGTGSGLVTSDPAGISCPGTCTYQYNHSTTVTLTASSSIGSTFSGWTGACTGSADCIIAITETRNVTANFTIDQHLLSVFIDGDGSGSVSSEPGGIDCPDDCDELFNYGMVVTLTAAADLGSTFSGWTGACTGSADCIIAITETRNVTATFTLVQYLLSVFIDGDGSGSVSSEPGGIDCPGDCDELFSFGVVVTLTAVADSGSTFSGWTGACSGSVVCVVTMDAAKSVTATFDTIAFEIYLPFLTN